MQSFLKMRRVARMATVDGEGQPYVVPVVYAYAEGALYTPLDAKPKRVALNRLRRVRNLRGNPRLSLTVDHYNEDWTQLAWVMVKGRGVIIQPGAAHHAEGVRLLHEKYPQYEQMPLDENPLIRVTVEAVSGWRYE